MFAVFGIVLVFAAVLGGFVMEQGHLAVLLQPAEFIIIAGAGLGSLLVSNPVHTLKTIAAAVPGVFGKSRYTRERYIDTFKMMYELLNKMRRSGVISIEADIEQPLESAIFKEYPGFLQDETVRNFVCDTMRMVVTGNVEAFDLDQMMDLDMEVQERYLHQSASSLTTVADSMPGFGIVAAVLGVVVTMGSLGGPAAEIGRKVAEALVGTFLGILLCYGLIGPIGHFMSKEAEEKYAFLYVLRVLMISFVKGGAPVQAVEIARRAVPTHVRPSFLDVETACRKEKTAASAAKPVEQPA